jgi:RNA ligase (TIGR02306 family)
MRNLASIKIIKNIQNIENSDTLALATIDGWGVVVKRGEYAIGDMVVYCEIDSWIPHEIAPFLSRDNRPKIYEGISGNRLKTIKLRGVISQGLLLPTSILNFPFIEGDDVSEALGIIKWERPIDAGLRGESRGNFPIEIPKTDEIRVQSIRDYSLLAGRKFVMHEKLEGSSITIYKKNGEFGVCSRNQNLKESDTNRYWATVRALKIEEILAPYDNIALQGELIGPGIQANIYKLSDFRIYFFNILLLNNPNTIAIALNENESAEFFKKLGLNKVPYLGEIVLPEDRNIVIEMADGNSVLYPRQREGIVFRNIDGIPTSFKAISNKYLLKQED